MRDFSRNVYLSFITKLQNNDYKLDSYINTNIKTTQKIVILRHDVDRIPENSLKLALIENSLGIKGTYYFRIVRESFNLPIMQQIANMGHEIGYHYEDVDLVFRNRKKNGLEVRGERLGRNKGVNKITREKLIDAAYESFCKNLEMLRKNFDIRTICMHGSPRAKYDNKIIWEKYNYKDLGIIGEPYFDIDFNEFAYFTDTSRRWNGHKYSVRDKVNSKYNFNFKTTMEIMDNINLLPSKVMVTIHPQRWHESSILWLKELIFQNSKNIIKMGLITIRNHTRK